LKTTVSRKTKDIIDKGFINSNKCLNSQVKLQEKREERASRDFEFYNKDSFLGLGLFNVFLKYIVKTEINLISQFVFLSY